MNINACEKLFSYLTDSTLRLHYQDQLDKIGEDNVIGYRWLRGVPLLMSELHETRINCGKISEIPVLSQVVQIVTNVL
jgi:hypothetical protein